MNGVLPDGWASVRLGDIAALNPRYPRDPAGSLPVTFAPMPAISESSPVLVASEERPLEKVRTGYTHFVEGSRTLPFHPWRISISA